VNSRQKGATAEREVAKLHAEWWGKFEPGCKFVKTPLSGGFSGPTVREAFEMSGDLMTTAKRFPFAVEVKRREGWCWRNVQRGMPSPVWGWWRQAIKAADEMHRRPALWFRKSREEWRVMVPQDMVLLAVPSFAGMPFRWSAPDVVWEGLQVPVSSFADVEASWSPVDLLRVDVGDQHPVVVLARDLLATDPALWASVVASNAGGVLSGQERNGKRGSG
jgi:hypothetical protein